MADFFHFLLPDLIFQISYSNQLNNEVKFLTGLKHHGLGVIRNK